MTTLINAMNNNQLEGIPSMKTELVRKYLPPSPTTRKGRMKHPMKGIQGTQKKEAEKKRYGNKAQEEPTSIPKDKSANETYDVNNVFCYDALADK